MLETSSSNTITRKLEPFQYSFIYHSGVDCHIMSPANIPLLFVIRRFDNDAISLDPQASRIYRLAPSMSAEERKNVQLYKRATAEKTKCNSDENKSLSTQVDENIAQFNDYTSLIHKIEEGELKDANHLLFLDKKDFHFTDLADYLLFRAWYNSADRAALLKKLDLTAEQFGIVVNILEKYSEYIKQTRLEKLFGQYPIKSKNQINMIK